MTSKDDIKGFVSLKFLRPWCGVPPGGNHTGRLRTMSAHLLCRLSSLLYAINSGLDKMLCPCLGRYGPLLSLPPTLSPSTLHPTHPTLTHPYFRAISPPLTPHLLTLSF